MQLTKIRNVLNNCKQEEPFVILPILSLGNGNPVLLLLPSQVKLKQKRKLFRMEYQKTNNNNSRGSGGRGAVIKEKQNMQPKLLVYRRDMCTQNSSSQLQSNPPLITNHKQKRKPGQTEGRGTHSFKYTQQSNLPAICSRLTTTVNETRSQLEYCTENQSLEPPIAQKTKSYTCGGYLQSKDY